jgi:hypothetical protein
MQHAIFQLLTTGATASQVFRPTQILTSDATISGAKSTQSTQRRKPDRATLCAARKSRLKEGCAGIDRTDESTAPPPTQKLLTAPPAQSTDADVGKFLRTFCGAPAQRRKRLTGGNNTDAAFASAPINMTRSSRRRRQLCTSGDALNDLHGYGANRPILAPRRNSRQNS